ncbi:MAG: FAD-dependent oxidoreductase, partial [Sphingomicrobium sp.]
LSELPRFTVLPKRGNHLTAGIIMAPSLDYMHRAWLDAEVDGWSKQPIIEMLIPSTLDSTLAPRAKHVASLFCQHFRYDLGPGRSWGTDGQNVGERETAADHVIATVEGHAPGFAESVIGRQIHSPLDLERRFGLIGGDIFHGKMSLDQLFSARPMVGAADYRLPLKGLYLCGSGAHPGGGVTGAPGHNAAHALLSDRRFWKRRR